MNATAPNPIRSITDTPAPALPKLGYFEQAAPVRLILGSFFFLTLPIAATVIFLPHVEALSWLYFWLLGGTHIVITLTIYASRVNRQYFVKTPRNAAIFIAAPLLILAGFAAVFGLKIADSWPGIAALFWSGVRFLNFLHLNRQTFGVLQLFKARSKGKFPAWAKQCENGTGLALVAALMVTHASGGLCPLVLGTFAPLDPPALASEVLIPLWSACVLAALGLFGASVFAIVQARPANGTKEVVLYFAFQFLGTIAATVFLPLYLAALAMHYVEYHILMIPRIQAQKLDESHRIDRTYGWLRARPIAFIGAILFLALLVTTGMNSMEFAVPKTPGGTAWTFLLTAFDALIVVHYFLEMFIWKFSDPHFRNSLNGVYFAPKATIT